MQISIIIPIYNVAPYIEKCLQSVTAQTFSGSMECLLIDDCGQDESMALAEHFVSVYKGNIVFRIFHHERNRGLSAARNTGIENACGEWLYFLDSDDWIIPECIQLMMECVEKHPDTEAVFAGAKVSNGAHAWMDFLNKNLPEFSSDRDWLQESMLKRTIFSMTAWNKLINLDFLLDNGLYFKEAMINEDELWNFQLSQSVSHVSFLKCNTYNYLKRENAISSVKEVRELWNRRLSLWTTLTNNVNGYRPDVQVKGICRYILSVIVDECHCEYPRENRLKFALLFFRMSHYSNWKSKMFMYVQCLLVLVNYRKFTNHLVRRNIVLE